MVVAVLFHRFAPSSRGLKRAEKNNSSFPQSNDFKGHATNGTSEDDGYYHSLQDASNDSVVQEIPWHKRASSAGHRRKPFKAMACLTSLASDLDVLSDWLFFQDTLRRDREYRAEWIKRDNGGWQSHDDAAYETMNANSKPYLIPPIMIKLMLISCILGTIMWTILATDGKVVAPLLRSLGIDKLSIGVILFLCVILEDIPQVVLTFLIEDYYEESGLSSFALCNVMASLYDTLIKIAEAIDARNDMVETGAWCKYSVAAAHSGAITSILTLLPDSDVGKANALAPQAPQRFSSKATVGTPKPNSLINLGPELMVLAPTPLPCFRFLTASLDGTIRLWDSHNRDDASPATAPTASATSRNPGHDMVCIRTFMGHRAGVTCLALLSESNAQEEPYQEQAGGEKTRATQKESPYILSGCQNGTTKLWNIDSGECLQNYHVPGKLVSSIAVVKTGSIFVTGYQEGAARLWDAWSGTCIAIYTCHKVNIRTICDMGDGLHFVTGSDDGTLRLWNSNAAIQFSSSLPGSNAPCLRATEAFSFPLTPVPSDELILPPSDIQQLYEEQAIHTLSHSLDAILCVACVDCGKMFVSGSLDRTARLWSVETGACLQIFSGHEAGVSAVTAIDEVTLLTGSFDTSVKVWDALSGVCLRTFTGHSDVVTGISVAFDETTFVTSSADRSIKLWVLTALPAEQKSMTLDEAMDISDGLCRGYDPS